MILVYLGEDLLGEVDLYLNHDDTTMMMMVDGIKIERFSQSSERCPPLAVLHTIANDGVWFRMESRPQVSVGISPLSELHSGCFRENKVYVACQEKFHKEANKHYWKAISDLIPHEVPNIEKRRGKKEQEKAPSITVVQGPKASAYTSEAEAFTPTSHDSSLIQGGKARCER